MPLHNLASHMHASLVISVSLAIVLFKLIGIHRLFFSNGIAEFKCPISKAAVPIKIFHGTFLYSGQIEFGLQVYTIYKQTANLI